MLTLVDCPTVLGNQIYFTYLHNACLCLAFYIAVLQKQLPFSMQYRSTVDLSEIACHICLSESLCFLKRCDHCHFNLVWWCVCICVYFTAIISSINWILCEDVFVYSFNATNVTLPVTGTAVWTCLLVVRCL